MFCEEQYIVRFHWILASVCGIFLFCSPARAGKILSWEFDEQDNNLVFVTDEGVQPEAQLLNNPTRLVIDLPETTLERETVKETYSGAIRGFRIGQPEPNTSRIVIEFAPGYTIEPDEIEFRGLSANQWTVEFPQPKIASVNAATRSSRPEILEVPSADEESPPELELDTDSDSVAESANSPYITTTRNGFLIEIDGSRRNQPIANRDGDRLDFELEGVSLPEDLVSQSVAVEQYGINKIEFTQTSTSPPEATMSLELAEDSPDWLATFSRIGGLILVPKGELPESDIASSSNESSPQPEAIDEIVIDKPEIKPNFPLALDKPENKNNLTVIEEIELTEDETQLSIMGDRDLKAVTTTPSSGIYEIQINNAQLSEDFIGPELKVGSPISQIRVSQKGSMVVVTATTRLRYRLGQLDIDEGEIAFPIETGLASLPPNTESPLIPPQPIDIPQSNLSTEPIPSSIPADDRPVVILDPGHGGQDPGTIGIDGLREKDLVLPISLDVAEILKKQGIEVRMTRDTDIFISLEGRTDFANNINADLFVSIHANAINLSRPDVNGLETYYYESGRRLAEVIHWNILNSVNIDNRDIRRARFYVLRHSAMPAVLVEVGFVTGAIDASNLKDPNHRRQMAEAIARGIIQYIKENNF
jgi:N-acetylmuramoyl-L-alanine amidase